MRKEVRNVLGRHWLRCARNRSSHLLKELSQSRGRDDECDQRLAGNVAPAVPCATGYVKVIARFYHNPFVALCALPKRLYLAGDDEKVLSVRVTVKRN